MNKTDFMNHVQIARAEWDARLDQVGPAHMTEAGVSGEWRVQDIIRAHAPDVRAWLDTQAPVPHLQIRQT